MPCRWKSRRFSIITVNGRILANDVERLKHWAAAMRAVKTEIYWVTKTNWPQVFRQAAEGKGLKNILLPLETEHGQLARAALADTDIEPRGFERKIDDWKNEFFADIEAGFSGSTGQDSSIIVPVRAIPHLEPLKPASISVKNSFFQSSIFAQNHEVQYWYRPKLHEPADHVLFPMGAECFSNLCLRLLDGILAASWIW